jgi:hypothetical protein
MLKAHNFNLEVFINNLCIFRMRLELNLEFLSRKVIGGMGINSNMEIWMIHKKIYEQQETHVINKISADIYNS